MNRDRPQDNKEDWRKRGARHRIGSLGFSR
jgi:hypothetical protein